MRIGGLKTDDVLNQLGWMGSLTLTAKIGIVRICGHGLGCIEPDTGGERLGGGL